MRFGERVHVKINMIGNMENQSVPPLLFLTFIENCFKHGTVDNNNLNILITFRVTKNNLLKFSVINNYNTLTKNKKKPE